MTMDDRLVEMRRLEGEMDRIQTEMASLAKKRDRYNTLALCSAAAAAFFLVLTLLLL